MNHLLTLIFVLLIPICNTTILTVNAINYKSAALKNLSKKQVHFDFEKFKIGKSRLGKIKTGMTISEAEQEFTGLSKKVDEATNFGFGGGSPAYLYYSGEEVVFGLIPKLDTDTLLFIIAAHRKLETTNGLNPNSTVGQLLQKYPDMTVYRDLMNDWEVFQDTKNGWDFVFMTDEKTQVGVYPDLESVVKPKRLTTRTDWITIR